MQHKQKRQVNVWKWAFWLVILLIFVVGGFISYQATRPIKDAQELTPVSQSVKDTSPVFEVTLTKKQAQRLTNHYINEYLNNKDIKYHLQFGKDVSLLGSAKFLGSTIDFQLISDPYPTNKGGIQLKAQQLKVGKLGIPLGFVMFYIQHNYHFPNWVQIDSNRKVIDINLQNYKNDDGYYFKLKQFDLKQDKIKVSVYSSKY
ncbi:YpmS family protein [Bombilactobacillus thymidiniphilus]|uniref:YpmS family protein n=1 Tax=Bombilactobacillus thymidiniphilus TaxID=2923363 RepID=A0ABY4PDY8_9LACO|nr:YpmS family protein [Bombilactobacillus thymidiniphilus]UQS83709.1 YpmS family protein [Bombilactobacillus thymidiniphilus]